MLLLAVDLGNSNISFGFFKNSRVIKKFSIPTKEYKRLSFQKNLLKGESIDVVICSVVPRLTEILVKDTKYLLGRSPYIIGKDIKIPMRNLYRNRSQVGQDRLVNAYAGVSRFSAPLIVVDFGTAVTFDVISKRKEYMGGMILPGLNISLDILHQRTALLPKIEIGRPREFIGRDTKNSMLSGIIYGFAAMADNLVEEIKHKIGKDAMVIGTGGNINLISRYCKRIDTIDIDLTIKGIELAYSTLRKMVL